MKRLILSLTILLIAASLSSTAQVKDSPYYVAAYVWPSCHNDPRGQEVLWPEGTGEWEVIRKGTPRFPGHYQPKQPLWGYEMDDDPKVMERWIEAAISPSPTTVPFSVLLPWKVTSSSFSLPSRMTFTLALSPGWKELTLT